MTRKVKMIPDKFRKIVEPILIENEKLICAFHESFKWEFGWDTLLPKWLVLTNRRLFILSREMPGVKVDEYHLSGMNIDLFRDNVGLYDSIEFRFREELIYQMSVYRTRRKEAETFERAVSEAIAKLDFGKSQSGGESKTVEKKNSESCNLEKVHLKDLERLGAITESEYEEEEKKPCEN